MRLLEADGFSLDPEAVHHVQHTQLAAGPPMTLVGLEHGDRGLLGRLEDDRVSRRQGGSKLQLAVEQREVTRMIWPTTPSGSWK